MTDSVNKEVVHHIHSINGLPLPLSVTQPQLESMKGIELFPDDIWVVTYPKCGTTWTQQVVRSILDRGDDDLLIDMAVPWVEAANSKIIPYDIDLSTFKHPRALKSHMPYNSMPCGPPKDTPGKYIYVARNPKDTAVSFFYHYFSFKAAENIDWPTFVSWFLSGQVYYGNYLDNVLSWWEHRDDDNVLFLKYEDMKRDIKSAIVRIASFIGKDLTEEEVDTVIKKSSFSNMKNNPTTNYEHRPKEWKHPEGTPFMRKGVVGGWKDLLTPEQSGQFDAFFTHKLKAAGLEF